MFTKFGPAITPLIRQTERTDTHLYIRQHEREHNRRKNPNAYADETTDFDDQASVSTEALLLFLESMVSRNTSGIVSAQKSPSHARARKPAGPNLYAAHAYAHAAKTCPQANNILDPLPYAPDNPLHKALERDHSPDHTLVNELIAEIRRLKERGIKELYIERGETFAGSLFQAIEKAKTL